MDFVPFVTVSHVTFDSILKFLSLGVDAIGDDDDLSNVYLPNFKQL